MEEDSRRAGIHGRKTDAHVRWMEELKELLRICHCFVIAYLNRYARMAVDKECTRRRSI